VRVSPAPPRRGMQRAESVLKKQRVHKDWLVPYLLPAELETVASASVFAGAFTYEAAVAVGCWAGTSGRKQQTKGPPMGASSSDRQRAHHDVADGEQLKGLALMSVLRESKASYTGAPRFSMPPCL
jgi:hypothetical protein